MCEPAVQGFNVPTPPKPPFEAILSALPLKLAVLDQQLNPILVNDSWLRCLPQDSNSHAFQCLDRLLSPISDAPFMLEGIRDVVEGRRESFQAEYNPIDDGRNRRRLSVRLLRENANVYALLIDDNAGDIVQEHLALQFEKLLTELTAAFVRAPTDEIDLEINKWLRLVVLELGLDRGSVGQIDPLDGTLIATHQWSRDGVPKTPDRLKAIEVLPWLSGKVIAGEIVVLDDVKNAPPEAAKDLEFAALQRATATVSIPLRIGGQIVGAVVFDAVSGPRNWKPQVVQQLRRVTEIFGVVLERQRSFAIIRHLRQQAEHVFRTIPMAEVTAALAHELNQPMGAILNNAQALRRLIKAKNPSGEDLLAAADGIVADVARATQTVRHTREVFESVAGGAETLSLNQMLSDIERILRNDAIARNIDLSLDVPSNLPPVAANRQGLIQVMMNLVLNGFDAVSGQTHDQRRIAIKAWKSAEEIHISVNDSGKGIDPKILPRLFDPFFTTKPKGTGLGLAMARSILEKHGGRIWAAQNSNPGATFELTLPTAPEKSNTHNSISSGGV
jgi:signal transduction histidine kinase